MNKFTVTKKQTKVIKILEVIRVLKKKHQFTDYLKIYTSNHCNTWYTL